MGGMPGPEAAPAAGAPGGGVGAPVGAAAPARPAHGTGYVNLESYINANKTGAQGMADAIGGDVSKLGAEAMGEAALYQGELAHSTAGTANEVNPALQAKLGTDATKAAMAAQALQSPGGIGALMTNHYGQQGGYGSGMRGFDSFLAGNAGGAQFQDLGNQYGGLDKYVSGLGQSYTPQVITNPGGPGMKGGPAGVSPPGMVSAGHYPGTMPGVGQAVTPPGILGGGGAGGEHGGSSDKRKRRAF